LPGQHQERRITHQVEQIMEAAGAIISRPTVPMPDDAPVTNAARHHRCTIPGVDIDDPTH
jgi:hypothetical protein